LPPKLDLTKTEQIKPFIIESVNEAVKVAKRVYEMRSRDTNDNRFGKVFAIYPEIFGYAALKARGEIVMELGGASGENAILLAFAGARKVYLNDINTDELGKFNTLKKSLPKQIQEKLVSLPGDCLDILAKRKLLDERVGFVLCRNLIHFFNDSQQKSFFSSLRETMKIGGHAIITANHYGFDWPLSEVNNKGMTVFRRVRVLFHDYAIKDLPIAILYDRVVPHTGKIFPLTFESGYLYKHENNTQTWKHTPNVFEELKLPENIKEEIKQEANSSWKMISAAQNGSVRILVTHTRAYTKENLSKLVQHYGFAVEATFFVDANGHLTPERQTAQIGVCVTSL
jgi:SAM-dependent methyltransferase